MKAVPVVPVAVVALVITGLMTAALIVRASVAVPVPLAFVALRATLVVPAAVGVPEITPVVVLTVRPPGRFVALYLVGVLLAVIW